MTTLLHGTIPTDTFALAETFPTIPEIRVVCERNIAGAEASVMPLLWFRDATQQALEDVLERDSTVADHTPLTGNEQEWLYRLDWTEDIHVGLQLLATAHATLLDIAGTATNWEFHALYPDRSELSTAHDIWQDHNLSVDIRSIRELETESTPSPPLTRRGRLTEGQYTALIHAYTNGYFAVPRGASLKELAAVLHISHQVYSKRLRRAHHTLIEAAFRC